MPSFKAFADFQKKVQAEKAAAEPAAPAAAPAAPSAAADTAPAAPAAPVAAPPSNELKVGMKVKVCNLQARPELNDLVGVLTEFEEARGRWKVELENGGGAKLFKIANLAPAGPADAAAKAVATPSRPAAPAAKSSPGAQAAGDTATGGSTQTYDQALDSRGAEAAGPTGPQKYGSTGGPSAAAVAAAKALAKGKEGIEKDAVKADPGAGPGDEEDDDEAFVRSIEQCLKESDVMWDDY
mmetsp:Transcript_79548/g.138016  ORF Transcript_79548/g.138016 Transcript_79548/m.138016 type:complete len:239 (+) Transcript_79548:95-811(+)